MTLVERARAHEGSGHKRLCEGRNYACTCGWDGEVDQLVKSLADRIEALEGVVERLKEGGRRQNSDLLAFSDEIGRLKAALREIDEEAQSAPPTRCDPWFVKIMEIARKALGEGLHPHDQEQHQAEGEPTAGSDQQQD